MTAEQIKMELLKNAERNGERYKEYKRPVFQPREEMRREVFGKGKNEKKQKKSL